MASSCNEADRALALRDAFCSEKVRMLIVRRLDLKPLLSPSSGSLGEDTREKRDLFRQIVPSAQLAQLESVAADPSCSAEYVNDEFLSLIRTALAERSLNEFVFWLDRYHADISKVLRAACPVTDRSECSIRVSSSVSLYGIRSAPTPAAAAANAAAAGALASASSGNSSRSSGSDGASEPAAMCQRCITVLAPLLDGRGGDWQKLFDAIAGGDGGKDVCRPSGKAVLASHPDQRQTAAMLGAWCRRRPRSEATLSQLIRLLHGESCFAAVCALVEQLRIEGESAGVRRLIREARDAVPKPPAATVAATVVAAIADESRSQSSSFPLQESLGPLPWDSAVRDIADSLGDARFRAMLDRLAESPSPPTLAVSANVSVDGTGTGVLYRFLCRMAQVEPLERFERGRGDAKALLGRWLEARGAALMLSHVRCALHECGLGAARDALEVAFDIPTMPATAAAGQGACVVMDERG